MCTHTHHHAKIDTDRCCSGQTESYCRWTQERQLNVPKNNLMALTSTYFRTGNTKISHLPEKSYILTFLKYPEKL